MAEDSAVGEQLFSLKGESMDSRIQGFITTKEEFLFPDSVCSELPDSIKLVTAKNGKSGIQILLETNGEEAAFSIESEEFDVEWYQMKAIPVEYNTGDGQEQGGAMVILPEEKPSYAVRKAPFWVYDCLIPSPEGVIHQEDHLAAAYLCIVPREDIKAGEYTLTLKAEICEGGYECKILIRVYDVEIPRGNFQVTNWFSLECISRFHHVKQGEDAYYEMVRKYAKAMRRACQTMFYLELDHTCVKSADLYEFDFSYLQKIIEIFFEEGMDKLEIGPILSRGKLENGMPDMYTDSFKCAMAEDIALDSFEGYCITVKFIKSLAEFLEKNGWDKKVVVHIHDEPDVHYKDEFTLEARKRQYFQTASILKKYLPFSKVIEAVKTTEFRGGVDIWVPVSSSFEEEKEEFLKLASQGEEIWNYVCCVPEGNWLNRFLDDAVIHSRLLFWGFEKYGLAGYLHWGFNLFQLGMDPFVGTSCPNHTGIGTNFPCGDAFIVYPGEDGPWYSMRLEAQRRGVEDKELLSLLKQKNPVLHDELIECVFTNNYTYEDDIEVFADVYEKLLEALQGN